LIYLLGWIRTDELSQKNNILISQKIEATFKIIICQFMKDYFEIFGNLEYNIVIISNLVKGGYTLYV
jgi:cytochrome c oxidase subunit IV